MKVLDTSIGDLVALRTLNLHGLEALLTLTRVSQKSFKVENSEHLFLWGHENVFHTSCKLRQFVGAEEPDTFRVPRTQGTTCVLHTSTEAARAQDHGIHTRMRAPRRAKD